jgi:serine/threonine protein phosphatase PrpC
MSETQVNSGAESLYRLLLWLYPAKFRRAYGQEMMQVFRDCYRDLQEQSEGLLSARATPNELSLARATPDELSLARATTRDRPYYTRGSRDLALVRFWCLVLFDLVKTASTEHFASFVSLFKRMIGIEKEQFMSALLSLDVAARTDIGRVRSLNEDNMVSIVPQDTQVMTDRGALFVVADGMGGHAKGEVASELAVNTVRDTYYHDSNPDIAASLQNALRQANLLICQQKPEPDTEKSFMGTTCVAAVVKGDRVYVSNAGDSLAYIVRGNQVMQIAENHSWVAEQVRNGAMSEAEARAAGKNNVIVRCLGETPDTEMFVTSEPVQDRDILVLCTDGLHNLIGEDEIRDTVTQYGTDEAAQRLIARANESGGPDNITALVVKVGLGA